MKRKFKVMVNNSTNINKTNNHLSPSLAEHKKRLTLEIRVMAWDMVQKCGGIDRVNGIPTPLLITGSPMAKHI
jgi:hypothetical protein